MVKIFHLKGADNLSITIKRNTGSNGIASKIQIKLNGKEVASIMEKRRNYLDSQLSL